MQPSTNKPGLSSPRKKIEAEAVALDQRRRANEQQFHFRLNAGTRIADTSTTSVSPALSVYTYSFWPRCDVQH